MFEFVYLCVLYAWPRNIALINQFFHELHFNLSLILHSVALDIRSNYLYDFFYKFIGFI
jgi:hypothetical protein